MTNRINDYKDIKQKDKDKMKVIKFDNNYKIISYINDLIGLENDFPYSFYNNLLFDSNKKLISCFPPLSMDEDVFLLKYSIYKAKVWHEGYYVSLHWDSLLTIGGSWNIHMKNNLLTELDKDSKVINDKLKKFISRYPDFLEFLNKDYVYHICITEQDEIYIYNIYSFNVNKNYIEIKEIDASLQILKNVKLPQCFNNEESHQKMTEFNYLFEKSSVPKIVVYSEDGNNMLITNPTYKYKTIVESIFPHKFYLYLYLKSINKLVWETSRDKLSKFMFIELENLYSLFLKTICYIYKITYIKKTLQINQVNRYYRSIIEKLHRLYIQDKKKYSLITTNLVKKIFSKFPLEEQLYFLCSVLK